MSKYHRTQMKALLLSITFILGQSAYADDTEIFFSDDVTGVSHNVMFIIDGSGSMDTTVESSGKSRLEVMKGALKTVLENAPDNLNVGLMNYGEDQWRNKGHGVKFPISPINTPARPIIEDRIPIDEWDNVFWWYSSIPEPSETITVRNYLSKITDWYWKDNWYEETYNDTPATEMPRKGATPIVDALYEAALYFRGEKLGFGLGDAGYWTRWAAHPSTYTGDLVKWDTESCQTTRQVTLGSKINFAEEEYDWYSCRAAGDDGTGTPSYENCASTEACITVTTSVCDDLIPGYCSAETTTETGSSCPDGAWVSSVCPSEYRDVEVQNCSYEICQGEYLPHPNYVTPIKQECQSNYIVLLSDGEPGNGGDDVENKTYQELKNGTMPTLPDKSEPTSIFSHVSCDANKDPSGFRAGICGPELSRFLADSDNSDLDGVQSIQTYAVGFGLEGAANSEAYLRSLVTTDDTSTPEVEGYFSAEDEGQLSTAFSEILAQISSSTTSFAAPGYSVNTSNGLSNEQVVYIPVFDKRKTPRWDGNLKKFKLGKDASGNNIIQSKDGTRALNELGVFEDSAVDLWSAATGDQSDGPAVNRGGASSLINPNTRLAVSDLSCSSDCDLTTTSNLLTHTNASDSAGLISNAQLGLADDATEAERMLLINYVRGRTYNTTTDVYDLHPRMGDMLHTEPVVVTYDDSYKANASVDTKYNGQVVYAATNEGYIHAFDTTSGEELFAYMPEELLKNIKTQQANTGSGNHLYGIDGNMSLWRHDADKDGLITAGTDDKVYLYFGLRRGGRSYYALDVTNPEKPKLLWKVTSSDPKFAHLGQSWSTPYLARVRTGEGVADIKEAVIFTGGYDINQDIEDTAARASADTMGNDVFIIDALNGDYIWSLQGGKDGSTPNDNATALTHSIPGGARLLDMNRDGAIDLLYFADTKSQVWRLELPRGPEYDLDGAKLIKFAELSESGAGGDRMIYNEPDVGLLTHGSKDWLTISVGSGYRAHPANDTISDNFYVMLDGAVNTPLQAKLKEIGDFQTIGKNDLVELKLNDQGLVKGEMTDKSILELAEKVGWYLKLPETGEKVLSNSITSNGSVMFTTLVPRSGASAAVTDPCVAPVTQGRFYSLNIMTGSAGDDLDKDGTITDNDLFSVVAANEIPGTPQRVFNEPTCVGESCEQIVDIRVGKKSSPITDFDSAYLESIFWTAPRN